MTEARGKRLGGPIVALVATMVAAAITATASARVRAQTSGQPRVLGAFIGKDTSNDLTTAVSDPAGIDAFRKMVGAPPRAVMLYQA